jgi:hypothetical protein
VATAPTALPWERQRGETAIGYALFMAYLKLGPQRTLRAAYASYVSSRRGTGAKGVLPQAPGRVSGQYARRSVAWRWAERAKAWDDHVAEGEREAIAKRAQRDAARRYRAFRRSITAGMRIIQKADLSNLVPDDARKLLASALRGIELGAQGTRLENGEATALLQLRHTGPSGAEAAIQPEAVDALTSLAQELAVLIRSGALTSPDSAAEDTAEPEATAHPQDQ